MQASECTCTCAVCLAKHGDESKEPVTLAPIANKADATGESAERAEALSEEPGEALSQESSAGSISIQELSAGSGERQPIRILTTRSKLRSGAEDHTEVRSEALRLRIRELEREVTELRRITERLESELERLQASRLDAPKIPPGGSGFRTDRD